MTGTDAADQEALAAAWHDLSVRYHRISCALDRELQTAHSLSGSEFEVLEQLHDAPEHNRRMGDLGERVHLTQSALSRVVGRLEKDGLVERTMCSTDRRSVFVTLTEAGSTRYAEARPTQRAILSENSDTCPQLRGE